MADRLRIGIAGMKEWIGEKFCEGVEFTLDNLFPKRGG